MVNKDVEAFMAFTSLYESVRPVCIIGGFQYTFSQDNFVFRPIIRNFAIKIR